MGFVFHLSPSIIFNKEKLFGGLSYTLEFRWLFETLSICYEAKKQDLPKFNEDEIKQDEDQGTDQAPQGDS